MPSHIAVIGAGPAGLMAADLLSAAGLTVTVYERMPQPGRKLLMAGRGGLNLTHSEPFERFIERYGEASSWLRPILEAFPPAALIAWAEGLDQPTFVGSSGRVFPKTLKASPLLRAWLARLESQGVILRTRREWRGWDDAGRLIFDAGDVVEADATLLALGGASWPRLGSTGAWTTILAARGVDIVPLRPANCGFTVPWSETFKARFAGTPLKTAGFSFNGRSLRGEAVVSAYGLEGGAIYALSAPLRDAIDKAGGAILHLDLSPDLSASQLAAKLARPLRGQSVATFLRKAVGLSPVAINLLREAHGVALPTDPVLLAAAIKTVPIRLAGTQSLDRAISSAGGVALPAVDETLMLRQLPGVYAAGEMLDWEAPTGGYLLQATLATGVAAARAIIAKVGR